MQVRYVAVGDSYSFGEGARPTESWPAVLAAHLKRSGCPTELVANPSRNGWTTEDALEEELPVFVAARPNFATLQIGVNDWVQGVSEFQFRRNFMALLDGMLAILPDKERLLVVNIPDFSVTPAGRSFFQRIRWTSSFGDGIRPLGGFDLPRREKNALSFGGCGPVGGFRLSPEKGHVNIAEGHGDKENDAQPADDFEDHPRPFVGGNIGPIHDLVVDHGQDR